MKIKKAVGALMLASILTTPVIGVEAQVNNVNTTVEVTEIPNLGRLDNQRGATIRFEEMVTNAWQDGESFVLRLPSGATWSNATLVNGIKVSDLDIDGRELTVRPRVSEGLDNVVIIPEINISRTMDFGDLEVTIVRGRLAARDQVVKIGEISDYSIALSRQGELRQLNFGDVDQKQVTVYIEEIVPGSLVSNVEYELLLEGAKFDESREIRTSTRSGNRSINSSFEDGGIIVSSSSSTSQAGRWELNFALIPEKEWVGDITLKLRSRDIEQDIVLFNIAQSVGINVTTPTSIALGVQNQVIPNITIRETLEGGLPIGTHAIEISPEYSGLSFTNTEIDILEGNIEVSDVRIDGNKIFFNVSRTSTRPSSIVLNGTRATIDAFGIEGEYTATLILNDGQNNEARDGSAVLFNVVRSTPIPGTSDFIAQFIIDNTTFTKITSGISSTETFDTAPYIENGRTMLSVAAAGSALDAEVSYDSDTRKVTVISGTDRAEMVIGDNIMVINGEEINMDIAPVIRNNRTFLPIAYLGQALGAEVEWVGATRTVILTKN